MIAPLVFRHAWAMPHTKTYKKYQLGGSDIQNFAQPRPRLPRRILGAWGWTVLHWAAQRGHAAVVEQLISAGAKVDAADNAGRGLEGFSGRFGSGSGEVTEGVRTLAGDFLLCFGMLSGTCCLRIHFCDGMGLLKFGWKKWDETSRKQKESRGLKVFTGFVFLMILCLIPHLSLKLWSPYGTNFDSRAARYFHCQR